MDMHHSSEALVSMQKVMGSVPVQGFNARPRLKSSTATHQTIVKRTNSAHHSVRLLRSLSRGN